jgi:hypothetical protein
MSTALVVYVTYMMTRCVYTRFMYPVLCHVFRVKAGELDGGSKCDVALLPTYINPLLGHQIIRMTYGMQLVVDTTDLQDGQGMSGGGQETVGGALGSRAQARIASWSSLVPLPLSGSAGIHSVARL